MNPLHHIVDPPESLAGPDTLCFLRALEGPTVFHFSGEDRSRTRVVTTLLHGNEPSGSHAARRWIKSGLKPATDLLIVIASIEAALTAPTFSHRMLPGHRDLNRCFRPPFDDREGRLARAIIDLIEKYEPEAVIDMHNTSGSGPAFGVCPHWDPRHEALVSLFAPRMVISELALGALMELTDCQTPTVTVEVGGRQDEAAHTVAWEGLQRFALRDPLPATAAETGQTIEVFEGSIRLELQQDVRLAYASHPRPDADVTLRPDIERFNFGRIEADTELGWCGSDPGAVFSAIDAKGEDRLGALLRIEAGRLLTAQPLRLFMVTTHPEIARSDCLLYAVCDADRDFLAAK